MVNEPRSSEDKKPTVETVTLVPLNTSSLTTRTGAAVVALLQISLQGGYANEMEDAWDDILSCAQPEELGIFAHADISPRIREKIYFHPRTPLDAKYFILRTFSDTINIWKRQSRKGNIQWLYKIAEETQDSEIIEQLIQNPTIGIRLAIAMRGNIPFGIAEKLSRDIYPQVRSNIAKYTEHEALAHALLHDTDINVVLSASGRDFIGTHEVENVLVTENVVLSDRHMLSLLKRVDLSAKVYRKILQLLRDISVDSWNEDIMVYICMHPRTSNNLRQELWSRLNKILRNGVVDYPF